MKCGHSGECSVSAGPTGSPTLRPFEERTVQLELVNTIESRKNSVSRSRLEEGEILHLQQILKERIEDTGRNSKKTALLEKTFDRNPKRRGAFPLGIR